ncbi:FtsK/SpoIIIE domain-containing protein [Streptomyces sp. S399]|uniref:FtsK/SpoIIIE domain-containing protein n=1 Tax=Streptomyces sp. S399 TaxID=3096009 RepID=UPI002A83E48E|nr:FtsK/SpoIIIE domain-containing protein [Streptomyces sp. S399]WPR52981.1 FtsK/SpoIIIE domain-containing protein [Streptomyces sp. S399]
MPATVDAVSPAWAERFARALAPLRPDTPSAEPHARVTAPLPRTARLLDELGLARATPASLLARWAAAADHPGPPLGPPGCVQAVLGAGRHGPVTVDLAADQGAHLLIEGPPGSGRTELLRALAASLCAAERPERLGLILLDGGDTGGPGAGEGLRSCTELPHVTARLGAHDPGVMREFAQTLAAELKRRAELLAPAAAPTPSVPAPRADRTTAIARDGAAARPGTVSHRALTGRPGPRPRASPRSSTPRWRHRRAAPCGCAPRRGPRPNRPPPRRRPGSSSSWTTSTRSSPPRSARRAGPRPGRWSGPGGGGPGRRAPRRPPDRHHRLDGARRRHRAGPPRPAARHPGHAPRRPGGPGPGRGTLTAPDSELPVPFQAGRVSGRIPVRPP